MYLQDQLLIHIGYCAVYGFRIDIPYLVQDMLDMSQNTFPLNDADASLPASINVQFMQENDDKVLSYGGDESLWWKSKEMVRTYRLTSDIMTNYFNDFYDKVMEGAVRRDKNLSRYFVFDKVDIPGLAKRRPKPIPSASTVESPSCTKCTNFDKIKEILRKAHYEIMQIEHRIDEALRVGVEAAD